MSVPLKAAINNFIIMKKKLTLGSIKVESFITKLDNEKKETIVGGDSQFWCSWWVSRCALSLLCGGAPPSVATPTQPASAMAPEICRGQLEQSRQYEGIGQRCPFPVYQPQEPKKI